MAGDSSTVSLEVATPTGKALSVEADDVQVPSSAGEFGVLPGHLPILAVLKPGVMKYKADGQTYRAAISSGFMLLRAFWDRAGSAERGSPPYSGTATAPPARQFTYNVCVSKQSRESVDLALWVCWNSQQQRHLKVIDAGVKSQHLDAKMKPRHGKWHLIDLDNN